jgi:sugar/nucleoside kinase (ribokinase family)/fructoselysine-6-P-deglycase FrlB-like protein
VNRHGPNRRVIVVGNLTIDDVVLSDGRTGIGSLGGGAIYAALGARLWSVPVGLVTRRGEDFVGSHLTRLADLGVDTSGVVDIPGPTVRNWVLYGDDGSRTWVYRTPVERSAEVAVEPADMPKSWLMESPAPVVHIAPMPLPAAQAMVSRVRSECPLATITMDTHEDWVREYREQLFDLARSVEVFIPSRDELADLVGYDEPERAAKQLIGAGVHTVVVKLGADGAYVSTASGTSQHVEAYAVETLDTTGAGDSFCGGLAAGLAAGEPITTAVQQGCVSASFAVESFGSMSLATVEPDAAAARLTGTTSSGAPSSTRQSVTSERYDIAVMMDEIAGIPEVVNDHFSDPKGAVRAIADLLVARGIEHLYLTGCGDSEFAALASVLAFARHTGVDTEAVHALTLARYRARYLPPRSAVLGISFSGKTGRPVEALVQAERFGHLTIGLTNDPDSALGRAAEHVLPIEVPTLGFSPGTSTYLGMLATLMDLALRWGSALGRDTSSVRAVVEMLPDLARETLEANAEASVAAVEFLRDRPWVTFLGAGPNEATARFGAAKLLEGPQILGVSTNVEEWAHEEYFVTDAGAPVVVVSPSGAGHSRAEEILSEIAFIDARAILVSDHPDANAAHLLPIIGTVPEEFSPILCALPLSLLGFHLAEALGKHSYNFSSEMVRSEHYETIHRATIGEPA